MTPTSLFEILRRRKSLNASAKYTSLALVNNASLAAGTETAPRGLALGAHATDGEKFDLAQGNNFYGFLTRRVVVGGLSLSDRVFGVTSAVPVGVESPFVDGLEVSVELAEEIEVEGPLYLYSGTGQIAAGPGGTAVGTNVSLKDGMWRQTQAGENAQGTLAANNLDPNTAGNLRVRIVMT